MSDLDLGALLQQAQQVKEQMEYLQKGLAEQKVEGTAGAGMVKVVATGDQRLVSVSIDPSVLPGEGAGDDDREMLQDLVVAAVNNALDRSRELAKERMGSMMPAGMPEGFPGL